MKKCPVCGKEVPPRRSRDRERVYCSRACFIIPKEKRACVVCGGTFTVRATHPRKCCSRACARIQSGLTQKGKAITSQAFYEARKTGGVSGPRSHPVTGQFETNCHAKIWRLRTPEGEALTVRNLFLYMRTRYGNSEGKRIASLIASAVRRGSGVSAGWEILAPPVLPADRAGHIR